MSQLNSKDLPPPRKKRYITLRKKLKSNIKQITAVKKYFGPTDPPIKKQDKT